MFVKVFFNNNFQGTDGLWNILHNNKVIKIFYIFLVLYEGKAKILSFIS